MLTQQNSLGLETPFDHLTALLCGWFGVPNGLVSFVHGDVAVFRSGLGLGEREVPRELSIANILVGMGPGAHLVIEDAQSHPVLKDHPLVVGEPFMRFFAGATVCNGEGVAVGAVGVMDTRPRTGLTQAERAALDHIAVLAGAMLDQVHARRQQAERQALLNLAEQMSGVGQWRFDVLTGEVTWSDEVYRIHGYAPGAVKPDYEHVLAAYHPDDRPVLADAVTRAIETGEGYAFRLRLLLPGQTERLVEAKAATERDDAGRTVALFGVFQDVTEAEAAVRRVRESEARYRVLADNAMDVIALYGLDGVFRYLSPSVETLIGYRPEDMIGRLFVDFIHPDDLTRVRRAFADLRRGRPEAPERVPCRVIRKDGSSVWIEARPRVVRGPNGRPVEFQDVMRDISQTKALEEALILAREEAEAGALAKAEFLANMSHELRTPLTAVIGFSGLLKMSKALGPTEQRYVDRIATASEALLSIVNDVLDFSKLDADAVELEPQAFDPVELVRGCADILEATCIEKGLRLVVELDPALPPLLMGDEGRLRQVLLNFLSNAVKFTPHGGITLALKVQGDQLRAEVTDTGIGVPADTIDRLFERFAQADASTSRVYGGTGLGLAISQRLIEMMGGRIGAVSQQQQGSTFWFEVPLVEVRPTTQAAAGGTVDAFGARILLADDSAANRELVRAMLDGTGLVLDTVNDGTEAVAAARTGVYDLVLMDIQMPQMDGLEATRAIRSSMGAVSRLPILALTANVQPDQVQRFMEHGMDGHVGKPIDPAILLGAIARGLAAARTGSGAGKVSG